MSGRADPKPERRQSPRERRRARETGDAERAPAPSTQECWGCGRQGANLHHLVPRDFTRPGPDEPWNMVSLCGSGTMGCHGAYHGNPYVDAAGGRHDRVDVARAILARLYTPAESWRLNALYDHLGTQELVYRFFNRQLSASDAQALAFSTAAMTR